MKMALLKDKIISTAPREKAGATSGSRFDYQKDWSICKLIEYHETKSDYVIIFDWHEDLIIMDSEQNPQQVSFYQIKGKKSGNWTLQQILKSETGKDGKVLLSIIGKLYDCKAKFDIETTALNFVSNARFKFKLDDKKTTIGQDDICVLELSKEDKNELKNKLIAEHNLAADPIYEDITFFKVLDLSLNDSATHAKGKISDFLDTLSPDKKFHVSSVYRMLFDEVKRRANYNKGILTYEDLLSNKAIGKSEFEKIIAATGIDKNYDEIWRRVETTLISRGLTFQRIKNLKQAWNKLELARMEYNNDYLNNMIASVKAIAEEQERQGKFAAIHLDEIIENVLTDFNMNNKIALSYNDDFVRAIILSEIYI